MSRYSPRNPDDVGVAILGAGRMGQIHIRNISAIPNMHVTVVADPSADAAARGRDIARARDVVGAVIRDDGPPARNRRAHRHDRRLHLLLGVRGRDVCVRRRGFELAQRAASIEGANEVAVREMRELGITQVTDGDRLVGGLSGASARRSRSPGPSFPAPPC